jgi:hypothetical protein
MKGTLMKSLKLTAAQISFTLFLYLLGTFVIGLTLFPSLWIVYQYWNHCVLWVAWQRILCLCFVLVFCYFLFGLCLIVVSSLTRIILRLDVKEGIHPIGSANMLKWMMASALLISVRFFFMAFMLLTPFCALFYKWMGAKMGSNVQINSDRVGDVWMLEIGDNSVIGGSATVICHSFEKNGLNIKKVKIGRNVIIGLNAIVMPGVEIGDSCIIAAGAILPKDTKVEPKHIYLGINNVKPLS